jgi:hypothetical protein
MSEFQGCPGSRTLDLRKTEELPQGATAASPSQLRQWPIQLHLISPTAAYFQGADVLLSADCVAHAVGGYHAQYLKGKSLAIACPKLDEGQEIYAQKISAWIDEARINSLTVLTMQVPCCSGLLHLALRAAQEAKRKVPIKHVVLSLQGEVLSEEWAEA